MVENKVIFNYLLHTKKISTLKASTVNFDHMGACPGQSGGDIFQAERDRKDNKM